MLQTLLRVIKQSGQPVDQTAFIADYLQRDLLNLCFGNSDNHGRNTAIIKTPHNISLAPVFDFAPMKADPEGIVRATNWSKDYQLASTVNWPKLCESFQDQAESEAIFEALIALAKKLVGLRERLAARGISALILDMPAMGFKSLDQNLKRWQLLP
ncbi:HipA domain-containing protein [Rheinheimera riviphila]|uniref:HipA domain-containing protein n=1 Tax=Rheinheimera riviphila TaxID=1834037 RepID=UPI0013E3EC7C|nr:HipA domain-containing protein [Rheinheimera riviphila]